jgi:hypothetical protein
MHQGISEDDRECARKCSRNSSRAPGLTQATFEADGTRSRKRSQIVPGQDPGGAGDYQAALEERFEDGTTRIEGTVQKFEARNGPNFSMPEACAAKASEMTTGTSISNLNQTQNLTNIMGDCKICQTCFFSQIP